MNSSMSGFKILATALCGVVLVACDSVKDVRESPSYAIPAQKVVLNGSITGVGNVRPVALQLELGNNGLNNGITTHSVRGTEVLRFGAVELGATYNVTVLASPTGRICSVENGSGTVAAEVNNIRVTCERDSTELYTVTASIATELANAPPEGFAVTLTTEEGVETIFPEVGQTSVTFANPVFFAGAAPPEFAYAVTATNTQGGTTNNCAVTNGTGTLGTIPSGTVPTNITNVEVTGCLFTISATASYSAPPGGAPQAIGSGGLRLGLKNSAGVVVEEAASLAAFGTVAFPTARGSNANAFYEVAVLEHPAGQVCIPDNGGRASISAPANVVVPVRCRDLPVAQNQLVGTYQLQPAPPVPTEEEPDPAPNPQVRNFLTFFSNGTFLYGTHHSSTAAGVEHGFYNFDPDAGTLDFAIFTDNNGGYPGAVVCRFLFSTFASDCPASVVVGATTMVSVAASPTAGLSGVAAFTLPMPTTFAPDFSYAEYGPPTLPIVVNATAVAKTQGNATMPGTLNLTFGDTTWNMVEPISTPGQMEGAWATADGRRVWVYNRTTLYGWHAGVNGAPNLQDRCYSIEDPSAPSGFYTQRPGPDLFGTPTCMLPGGNPDDLPELVTVGTVEIPSAANAQGFAGKMPGSQSTNVVVPSPVYFTIVAGAPDTMTIQNTLNDVPVGDPIVFTRVTAN